MAHQTPGSGEAFFAQLLQTRVDVALCRATTLISRAMESEFEDQNFGVAEHLVLTMVSMVGPLSQQALSMYLRIDRSAMVGVIDSLEGSGFARRERDPCDRRAYRITITDEGHEVLADSDRFVHSALDASFAALTLKERRELSNLLSKLILAAPAVCRSPSGRPARP